jgi:hypothetical protein
VNTAFAVETSGDTTYTDDASVVVTLEGSLNAEGEAELSWTEYQGSDLSYYKVVHSQTVVEPKYPDDGYIEVITDSAVTSYTHADVPAGTNYYSLCVITTDKKRGCSTVTIVKEGDPVVTDPTPEDPYTDDPTIEISLMGELNSLGKAELSWTEYDGGDLKWYKVVHSQINDNAYYPVDGYIQVYSDAAETSYTHTSVSEGTNYYRVCVITDDNRRGCSNTITLEKGTVEQPTFPDVELHWAKEFIEDLALKGVVEGYDDGNFHPDEYVTRSEAIKMIMNNLEKECDASIFPDMYADQWFCGVVTKAHYVGAVEGDNGYLYPERNMSRAEAVKVLLLVKGIDPPEIDSNPFDDVSYTQWYAKYVYKASILGYVEGENGSFYPDRPISRSELAKIVSLAWK